MTAPNWKALCHLPVIPLQALSSETQNTAEHTGDPCSQSNMRHVPIIIFQLRCHFCSWSTRLQRIRAEPVLVITITAGGLNNAIHLHVYIYGHSRTHNAKHAHKKQNLNWMWLFPHTPPSLANNFYAAELNRCCKEHYDLLSYFSAVQRWKPERYDKLQTRLRLAYRHIIFPCTMWAS